MSEKKKETKPTGKGKALNPYIKYSTMAITMGIVIGLGTWLGVYLDENYGGGFPVYTLICSLASIGLALYLALKDVIKK